MGKLAANPWMRIFAGGFLVFFAGMLLPASIQASCGDYVVIQNEQSSHPQKEPSKPDCHCPQSDSSPYQKAPTEPCRGPGCSNQPAPAPQPMTSVSPRLSQERLAVIIPFSLRDQTTQYCLLDLDCPVPCTFFVGRVFRPPRPA